MCGCPRLQRGTQTCQAPKEASRLHVSGLSSPRARAGRGTRRRHIPGLLCAPGQFPGPRGPHLETQALAAGLGAPRRRPLALVVRGPSHRRRLLGAPGRGPQSRLAFPGLPRRQSWWVPRLLPARPHRGAALGLLLLLRLRPLGRLPRRPLFLLRASRPRRWWPRLSVRRPGPLLARRGLRPF